MKRIALYIGIVASLVASCSIQEEDIKAPVQDDVIFYASFEQPSEGTRVYVNEDLLLRWNADDRVSIFNKNTYNQQYRFIGETGDNAGEFNRVDAAEFVTGNPVPHVVSVYPYQEGTKISEEEILTLTLPAEQRYAENTFGLGANTMVSVSEDNFLQYKNVGGYLVIKLYGEGGSVSSITLKGNNGEKLAGKATVTMPVDGDPSVEMASAATTEITLICEAPVQLGASAEESTQFWFVVPPVTFSEGFLITVNLSTGGIRRMSTSKSVTIERNKLSKMSPIEVIPVFVPEAIDLGLPSGLKWAPCNVGASNPEDFGDYFAWGEIQPKSDYSWFTYQWSDEIYYENLTKYITSSSYGTVDNKTVLDVSDDAGRANWGGSWRMPTEAEWTELRTNCTWTWTTREGKNGYEVKGPNGNTIFLPAAGYRENSGRYNAFYSGGYWSSSLATDTRCACGVSLSSEGVYEGIGYRFRGLSVRPVDDDPAILVDGVMLDKAELGLSVGESSTLVATVQPDDATIKTLTWSSSDYSVATVSSTGVVTAVSVGSVTITVTTRDGGKEATCHVTVSIPIPEAVDLGLPSGLKWASFNLVASRPEEYGYYFAWGETSTSPKSDYVWDTYKWCRCYVRTLTKYCTYSFYGYDGFTDMKTVLDPEDDAAHVNLGGNWRMPTVAEWTELLENCTWEWATLNGVNGQKVTGKKSGYTDKWIFLPAAGKRYISSLDFAGSDGYYWSSSLGADPVGDSDHAWFMAFSSDFIGVHAYDRCDGLSVRPVTE